MLVFKNVVETPCRQGSAGGVFKEFFANFVVQADGFEQMAIAIARDGGNSHARENFAQPGFDGNRDNLRAAGFQTLLTAPSRDTEKRRWHRRRSAARCDAFQSPGRFRRSPEHRKRPRAPFLSTRRTSASKAGRAARAARWPRSLSTMTAEVRCATRRDNIARTRSRRRASCGNAAGPSNVKSTRWIGRDPSARFAIAARWPASSTGETSDNIRAQIDVERHHVHFAQRINRRVGHLRETLLAVIPQRAA